MVWLAQKYRLEFEAAPGLLVEPRVLDSDGGLVGKGNHELHLLRAKQVAMAAIDTDTPENFLLDLQGDAEHQWISEEIKGSLWIKQCSSAWKQSTAMLGRPVWTERP